MAYTRKGYQDLKAAQHEDQGQNPKPLAVRKRKPKKAVAPTWPRTPDQKKQSRPLIVLHPVRQMIAMTKSKRRWRDTRLAGVTEPKHFLDGALLRMRA